MITAKEALDMTKGSSQDIPDEEIQQAMEECEGRIRDWARLGVTNVYFRCLDIEHVVRDDHDEKLRASVKARILARALEDLGYDTRVCVMEPWRIHIDWSKGYHGKYTDMTASDELRSEWIKALSATGGVRRLLRQVCAKMRRQTSSPSGGSWPISME